MVGEGLWLRDVGDVHAMNKIRETRKRLQNISSKLLSLKLQNDTQKASNVDKTTVSSPSRTSMGYVVVSHRPVSVGQVICIES